jgi:hypothetical protein
MFAAVMGRFLTSIAAWKLERGVTVATVEHLLGSRTVFGAIITPLRLRVLRFTFVPLICLWTLSPLGSQASLRIVSSADSIKNTTRILSYLDNDSDIESTKSWPFLVTAINAAFVGSLGSSATSKATIEDPYGNLRTPFIETLGYPNEEGWRSASPDSPLRYSSLLGIPVSGARSRGTTYFSIESAYVLATCKLTTTRDLRDAAHGSCSDGNAARSNTAIRFETGPTPYNPATTKRPRIIVITFLGYGEDDNSFSLIPHLTTGTCDLTTTYVETRYRCDGDSCVFNAMRASSTPRNAKEVTWLDRYPRLEGETFCSMFINSTRFASARTLENSSFGMNLSPLGRYILDPATPFNFINGNPIVAEVGEEMFSQRFTQLLNTYRVATIAPYGVTGNFSVTPSMMQTQEGYKVRNATAQVETTETVHACNTLWFIVLALSSLAMIAAGLATTVLNLVRKGPEILDSFASMLRDSPYIQVDTGPSTEDGPDKARRLNHTVVVLADTRPMDAAGFIALTTNDDVEKPVQLLRRDRKYL